MGDLYIDWDNVWTTVISGTITGLVVGGILGLVGYFIWKRQNDYSKKQDAAISLIVNLFEFSGVIMNLHLLRINNSEEGKIKEYIKETNSIFGKLLNSKTIYFQYLSSEENFYQLGELQSIYTKLRNKIDINMTKEELTEYVAVRMLIVNDIK
ncbi:MAG: hypothetical protein JZU53_13440 [Paludibacter sp.]|nr:hypothetical protein [Paludibacter sp.]